MAFKHRYADGWYKNAAGLYVQSEPISAALVAAASVGDAVTVAADGSLELTTPSGGAGATVLYDSGALASAQNAIDTGAAGIAGGHNVLELWILARITNTSAVLNMTFNNDTGANYHRQFVRGVSTTVSANTGSAENAFLLTTTVGGTHAASNFGILRITVPFYVDTTAYKIIECFAGNADTGGTTNRRAEAQIGVWANTAAITRIAVAANAGLTLVAGSRMIVYGR